MTEVKFDPSILTSLDGKVAIVTGICPNGKDSAYSP
jgi:hypothetical protein